MKKSVDTILVNTFVDGILDPEKEMLGPLKNGGHIIANTAPGCWGPMLTPKLKGGHEVTQPVFVEGAEVGDAIAIKIISVEVTSMATASGSDNAIVGRFNDDPFVAAKCDSCGALRPETEIKGIGKDAIVCKSCGKPAAPFELTNGYTIVFSPDGDVGLTVTKASAEKIAKDAKHYMCTPEASIQNPVVSLAPHDLIGAVARMRPFLGQLGTTPSKALPDSHNAGDFGAFLVGANHEYAVTQEELNQHKTDGHMDISRVRAGSTLICPVKVQGGGIYLGDMHAMQGDGEISGHTADVAGVVHLQVHVLKNVNIDGPILLPNKEDLPYTAKPLTEKELYTANKLAKEWGVDKIEESLPISIIGTGATLNDATTNGLERAAGLFNVPVEEIMNRSTITGSIEIGRHPGVVTVTFQVPQTYLEKANLLKPVHDQYKKR
jgi:acetamidase/formamidase